MLKKYVLPAVLSLLSLKAQAQTDELTDFNQRRLRINKIGMFTLGTWAVGNMAVSGLSISGAEGSQRYFHQMNVYWNVVNLGLAGFGLYGAFRADPAEFNASASVREHYNLQKLLLLNAGLDVAYIAGGMYLIERAKNSESNAELLNGFGRSVIMQGGFLLLFDAVLYFIHQSNGRRLHRILSGATFTGQSVGVNLRIGG